MSVLIRVNDSRSDRDVAADVAIAGIFAGLLIAFILLPGDIAHKAHLALHGLCAQRPSHSISLGGDVLPLDARMTGIYLGAVMTICWLAGSRRLRAVRLPPPGVNLVLAFGVAVMAGDGVIGLLTDLHLPRPYEPSNVVRLATGMSAGIALGAGLGHLIAITVWANPDRQRAVVEKASELLWPIGMLAAIGVLVMSGLPVFFTPLAIGLVIAVVVIVATLSISLVLLGTNRAWSIHRLSDLRGTLLMAVLLSITVIGALSAVRLVAESMGIVRKLT